MLIKIMSCLLIAMIVENLKCHLLFMKDSEIRCEKWYIGQNHLWFNNLLIFTFIVLMYYMLLKLITLFQISHKYSRPWQFLR